MNNKHTYGFLFFLIHCGLDAHQRALLYVRTFEVEVRDKWCSFGKTSGENLIRDLLFISLVGEIYIWMKIKWNLGTEQRASIQEINKREPMAHHLFYSCVVCGPWERCGHTSSRMTPMKVARPSQFEHKHNLTVYILPISIVQVNSSCFILLFILLNWLRGKTTRICDFMDIF